MWCKFVKVPSAFFKKIQAKIKNNHTFENPWIPLEKYRKISRIISLLRRNKKRRRYVFISAHFSSITWEYEFSSRFIYGLMQWLENADSLEYTANNRCDLFSRVADAYRGTSEGCHCQCRNGRFHDALHVTTIFHSFFFSLAHAMTMSACRSWFRPPHSPQRHKSALPIRMTRTILALRNTMISIDILTHHSILDNTRWIV